MKTSKIIYPLAIESIQNVSDDVLGRDLTPDEILKIIDPITEK
jgi:hypothetical protein